MKASNNRNRKGKTLSDWVLINIKFVVFIVALIVFYIANGHNAESKLREIKTVEVELSSLGSDYRHLQAKLIRYSKPSTMEALVSAIGLSTGDELPEKILISKRIKNEN